MKINFEHFRAAFTLLFGECEPKGYYMDFASKRAPSESYVFAEVEIHKQALFVELARGWGAVIRDQRGPINAYGHDWQAFDFDKEQFSHLPE